MTVTVILYPHNWNTGFWATPRNNALDPMVCRVNSNRVPCTWSLNPLTFIIQTLTVVISSSSPNVIRLESEYLAPYNGVAYPQKAGNYLTKVSYVDNSSVQVGAVTFYTRVDPQKLFDFHVSSVLSDLDT